MTPVEYDAWYDTPRGRWIGANEWVLLHRLLAAEPGQTLLDVGCGTGWFARRFAADGLRVTGIDPDPAMLDFARTRGGADYVRGDARALPFADGSFDHVVSVAALCFIREDRRALEEIVRVCRGRFAIGLLNRYSLLWADKGRGGGRGAYLGAHWHRATEARALLEGLPVRDARHGSAVFLPSGRPLARIVERLMPMCVPWGALWVMAGRVNGCASGPRPDAP